jgi:hypothetical protein
VGVLDRLRDHGGGARQHARLLPPQALALSGRRALAPLAAFLGLSFLYFGVAVAAHPGRDWVGTGTDPQIFVWSLAWWPHAVLHGESPFVTHAVWPTVGLDLAWVSSIPGLAAALMPVTLAAGPVAAYDVAAVLLPALAAWTAFLLCRHVTRRLWPSLLGGYLFGFSSYELGQLEGHMHMSAVFLVPLAALLVLRYVEGALDARGLVLRLGPLLALQLLLSTELALTLTLALVVACVAAFALVRSSRPALRGLWRPLAGAYLLAGVLASPLLAYAVADFQRGSLNEPSHFPADLLNIVVPTPLAALHNAWSDRTAAAFIGNNAENGAYLGLPLLSIVAWFAWQRRRRPAARLLLVLLAVAIVAELGPDLRVRGATYAPLPWKLVAGLPALDNVLPVRFALYVVLVAAVIAALWAAGSAPLAARVLLPAAAVAATFPSLGHGYWHGHPHRVAFFADGTYRACLEPGATLLALPYPSISGAMLWQAEAGFRFRLADAWLSPLVPDGVPHRAAFEALHDDSVPAGGGRELVALARASHAEAIIVDPSADVPWNQVLAHTGVARLTLGGVDVYDLSGTLAACRSRSGRRGASSTSSTPTTGRAASSASRRTSSCSRAARTRSSCSTASPTPRGI